MAHINQEYYLRQGQFGGLHGLLAASCVQLLEQGAEIERTNEKLKITKEKLEQSNVELIEYKQQANYWETQFRQLKTKEEELGAMMDELKAELRKREQQLFGRKSERRSKQLEQQQNIELNKKNRGQQQGSKGHGRRHHDHLPQVEETVELREENRICPCCGMPYEELTGTEDSEILEVINVKAYCRTIKRKKYLRCCQCKKEGLARIITAPLLERLLPKSTIGTSIWAFLLLKKYEYQQPTYRTLKELTNGGLSLSLGTVTDGFCRLLPFLSPVYDAIVKRNVEAKHWHADETGWKVFETIEGKANHRWYLWIFSNRETVVYKLDPSRSSKVLIKYFGDKEGEKAGGILNVDRYVAYKVIAKSGLFTLAFCWAHVRRDFLEYSKAYPGQEAWGLAWVERIGKLYRINNERVQHEFDTQLFRQHDQRLHEEVKQFATTLERQLADVNLLPSAKKLLKSLTNHWSGLTVFVEQPDIPMDNNEAERGLRPSVVGRKNYYGSFAIWAGNLAVAMFTIFATMKRWNINPHTWLIAYFQECSALGQPPDVECVNKFLPWNMAEELKLLFTKPPIGENSS